MLDQLNDPQRAAVTYGDGPLLILAGAGSGKTRALTHRIAYLIQERGVPPWAILAITFTNKAAAEMKERVAGLLGAAAVDVWVATFHSTCARILRREAAHAGLTPDFAIYDTADQRQLVRQILSDLRWESRKFPPQSFLRTISDAKNELVGPEEYAARRRAGDPWAERVARVYRLYQGALERSNAVDFDDLIAKVVTMFRDHPEVLARYQERFRHILVDEYQDTNHAQYRLVSALAARHRNLTVVGDDDQSIYAFRGADTRNILDFEREYPDAHVVKLEQNYRSTVTVLEAANSLVRHNALRKPKRLWTRNDQGCKIRYYQATDQRDEAAFVAYSLNDVRVGDERLGDCVVLYRTNAQSRPVEEALIHLGIPYQIVGGLRFYERKEVKDMLAYLRLVANPADTVSLARVINVPKRGVGPVTWARLAALAQERGVPVVAAMAELADGVSGGAGGGGAALPRAVRMAMGELAELLGALAAERERAGPDIILQALLERTGYLAELEAEDSKEANARLENLEELMRIAAEHAREAADPSLRGFLEQIALVSDVDTMEDATDRAVLMTVHTAKGLEFDQVFVIGLDEGIFPHQRSLSTDGEIEEERRLCYVALTRARKALHLSTSSSRTSFTGESEPMLPSRFLGELPADLIEVAGGGAAGGAGADGGRAALRRAMVAGAGVGAGARRTGTLSWQEAAAAGRMADTQVARANEWYRQRAGQGAPGAPGAGGAAGAEPGIARGIPVPGRTGILPGAVGGLGLPRPEQLDAAGLPRAAERVRHPKWGEGVVVSVTPKGEPADALIAVAFDGLGIKKLVAGYARLERLDPEGRG